MDAMYLRDVRETLEDEFGVPARTFQWYLSEDLIPKPEYEGREGYYDLEAVDIVHFVCALRVMNREFDIPLKKASTILRKYQKGLKKLVDLLGGLAEEYEVRKFPSASDFDGRNARNRAIRRWFFRKLEEGIDLKTFSLVDLVEEIKNFSRRRAKPQSVAK